MRESLNFVRSADETRRAALRAAAALLLGLLAGCETVPPSVQQESGGPVLIRADSHPGDAGPPAPQATEPLPPAPGAVRRFFQWMDDHPDKTGYTLLGIFVAVMIPSLFGNDHRRNGNTFPVVCTSDCPPPPVLSCTATNPSPITC